MTRVDQNDGWNDSDDGVAAADSGRPQEAAWIKIHRLLKGRYLLMAILALVFAGPLTYLGWRLGRVEYTSTGMIRVRPVLPKILYSDEEKGVLPMFDSFVLAQVELINNARVRDVAMQSARWTAAYGKADDAAVTEFTKSLTVTRRGEMIVVSVVHREPATAQAGVQAVVDAYRRIVLEQDAQEDEQRIALLQQRQTSLNSETVAIRQRIAAIATEYGSEDLEPIYNAKFQQVAMLESKLQDERLLAAGVSPSTQPANIRMMAAASSDMMLRDLLSRKAEQDRLISRAISSGLGERNQTVIKLRADLATLDSQIEQRFAEVKEGGEVTGAGGVKQGLPGTSKERIAQIETMLAKAKEEMLALGRQSLAVNDLKRDLDRVRGEAERVRSRIEMLNVESAAAGRISVASEGDRPIQPSKDSRIRNAGMGLVGGVGIALLIAIGLGLRDRRVNDLADVEHGSDSTPILGVLPQVPEGLEDQEISAQAAHNVHHIRTMLEIWGGGKRPLTLTVTGPSAGSGKTSLTVALGVSFAAAGFRTLLIDLDFIGGGLTARMQAMARRRLGSMLVTAGTITDTQRIEAVKIAKDTGKMLGEVLTDMGLVTADQVRSALLEQSGRGTGVHKALDGGQLADCVQATAVSRLWVLGVSPDSAEQAGSVASHQVRRLLDATGEDFDVVLIDTGPTPGSLEAGTAAAVSAGVVLAVSRGEDRLAIARCRNRVREVGGRIAGVVFNRADTRDAAINSSTSQPQNGRSIPRLSEVEGLAGRPRPNGTPLVLGPVGQAVAGSVKPRR